MFIGQAGSQTVPRKVREKRGGGVVGVVTVITIAVVAVSFPIGGLIIE